MTADRPLVFLSGKGGVGKTTLAAAVALSYASRRLRTLLVSTDPAHSTADVLGVGLGAEPTAVADGLLAVEIDAEAAAAAHIDDVKRQVAASIDPELLPAVRRHLDLARLSPGTVESAMFDRLVALMERCPGEFDRAVFDTAPTGHTLRLLTLPALLSAWVEGLARQRERVAGTERMLRNLAGSGGDPEADPLLERLHDRRARFRRAGERLRDEATFWLVLTAERLPIEETARTHAVLREQGLHVGGLVVNRLVPASADGAYMAARRDQQETYLAEALARFDDLPVLRVDQLPTDVTAREDLLAIAAQVADAF